MFEKEKNPKFIVSNEFLDIYKNFNVCDQIQQIKALSEKERYALLILCLDRHDYKNPIVLYNYKPFINEIREVYKVQDDKETNIQALNDLINETNHNHIETDFIVDIYGKKIPDPFTINEVRNKKIDIINNI